MPLADSNAPALPPIAMPDVGEAALAGIMGHPAFDAALLRSASSLIELHGGRWALNRAFGDRGRFLAALMMLDLDFTSGPPGGFRAAALRADASVHGICSPGRITALLAVMQCLGFVRPLPLEGGRGRRLAPTDRLLGVHRERFRHQFEALALIDPAGESGLAALWTPGFVGAFAHVVMTGYRGWRPLAPVPELRPAAERDSGICILFSLLLAAEAGEHVSIAALARRFSVSRAHVLTVLRDAESAGAARLLAPRGGYTATSSLRGLLGRFLAVMFLTQRHAIIEAHRLCPRLGSSAVAA